jgi:outer membrane protein TolC
MDKKIFFVLYLIVLFSLEASAADTISKGDVLTLRQCIEIALKNHPSINAATNTVKANESRIGQAQANYYPQLNFQFNYQRTGPPSASFLNPDIFNQYTNILNMSQTIFDFGKTFTQVEIQSLNKESSQADLQDITGQVILGVKQTYLAYSQSKMNRDVALETVTQFKQHYEIAKSFFDAGKNSKIDVTSAEVNLSNNRINLLKAQNALRLARINLNNAMGILAAPEYEIYNELTYKPYEVNIEDALQKAYGNRPDLLSIAKKKVGLEKTIDLNKKGYLPVLSGVAAYGYTADDLSIRTEDKYWNIGVTLTFPLFSGLSTKYQVAEARSNLEVLRANEDSLKQKVYLEVETAFLLLREAEQRISAGEIIVRQAQETVELARGRYAAGVGSSIEITDAMITLNNAKITYITALSDFSAAQASLEKATGVQR